MGGVEWQTKDAIVTERTADESGCCKKICHRLMQHKSVTQYCSHENPMPVTKNKKSVFQFSECRRFKPGYNNYQ